MCKVMKLAAFWAASLLALWADSAALADDLIDVLVVVYQSNPNIKAERNRLDATEELTAQARSVMLPQISAAAAVARTTNTQTRETSVFGGQEPEPDTNKLDNKSLAVTAEQPLFTGFRNRHALEQARARVRSGAAQLAAVEEQILLRAATAYFDVARDLAVYNANASNVEVLLQQRKDADVRFELGEITRTDTMQAEARLAGARAQLSAAKTQLSVSRAEFKEVVGIAPGTLELETPLPELPDSLADALSFSEAFAPPLISVRQEEEASRRQIRIARSTRLPTVSFTASYSMADEPSPFLREDEQWSYGVRARVPLFQGGLTQSRIREAKALNRRDRARIIASERSIEAQVTGAWEQLFETRARIASAKAQSEANELALQGVRREAQLGARTTLDVLNAEQEFLNATVAYASAQRDEQVAAYTLLATIGALAIEVAETLVANQQQEPERLAGPSTAAVLPDDAADPDPIAVLLKRQTSGEDRSPQGDASSPL